MSNKLGNTITVYPAAFGANPTPARTITGLATPEGIALDPAGDVYVADFATNTIAEYGPTASGAATPIATIAGTLTKLSGPMAIARDTAGNLFVVNHTGGTVTEYAPGTVANRAPINTLSGLSSPDSIALTSFDDLVVGTDSPTSFKVYLAGATGAAAPLQTIVPTGLTTPGGLALPDGQHILATGTASGNVESVLTNGAVDGTNAGATSLLNAPVGLVLAAPLTLGAAEAQQPSLTVGKPFAEHTLAYGGLAPDTWSIASGTLPAGLTLNPSTGLISGTPTTPVAASTVVLRVTDSAAPSASATNTRTYTVNPVNQPSVYVANGANTAIHAFALGLPGLGLAPWTTFTSANGLNAADGLAFDPMGHLFAANYGSGTITEYPPGAAAQPIATQSGLTTPAGITVGSSVWVSEQASNTIAEYADNATGGLLGAHLGDIAGPQTLLSSPAGVILAGGLLWVANSGNNTLTAYNPQQLGNAAPVKTISAGLALPVGLAVDSAGDLLVANEFGPSVTVYPPGATAPARTITSGALSGPKGVDVDSAGQIYVANDFSSTVTVFAATAGAGATPVNTYAGAVTFIAGPSAVAVTPPLSILTTRLPRARLHHRYRARLLAAEGTTPYRWSLRRGRLPRGLRLNHRTGIISGRPRHAGRRRLTFALRDSSHPRVTRTQRLVLVIRRR